LKPSVVYVDENQVQIEPQSVQVRLLQGLRSLHRQLGGCVLGSVPLNLDQSRDEHLLTLDDCRRQESLLPAFEGRIWGGG